MDYDEFFVRLSEINGWLFVFIDIALVSRVIYSLYKLRIRRPITNLRNNKVITINLLLIMAKI